MSTMTNDLASLLAGKPSAIANPWSIWKSLLEAGPVVPTADGYWITDYDHVRSLLRDPYFRAGGRSEGTRAQGIRAVMTDQQREAFDEITEFASLFMNENDGDEHARLRRIAQRAFTPKRIAELQEATERYVDDIVSTYAGQEVADLKELAYRVPLMIIGDLLGVPPDDRDQIKDWSTVWFAYRQVADDRVIDSAQAGRELLAYVEEAVAEHRRRPHGSGLVADLVAAEREERVSAEEQAAMFFVLLFAGHETTTNLIATGVHDLLRHRDQWNAVCADPEIVPNAIEELLRFVTPVQWAHRMAPEDAEIAGVTIPAGTSIQLALAAANRDPDQFAEPNHLDVRRTGAERHVAFGFGAHYCLGASLARLEGAIALRSLTKRFPELQLASDDLEWQGAPQLRGLSSLPVHPGPESRG